MCIYVDRNEARSDVFDYIGSFSTSKRRQEYSGNVSPVKFEEQHFSRLKSIYQSRGDSFFENYGN